jgi:uncharacterized Zn ribbon protein
MRQEVQLLNMKCVKCNSEFTPKHPNQLFCHRCSEEHKKAMQEHPYKEKEQEK